MERLQNYNELSMKCEDVRSFERPMLDGYTFRALRGRGAQAEIWSATNASGRKVAVKIYDIRKFRSWKEYELIRRQIDMLGGLDILGVPSFRDFAEKDSQIYLVTDFVEGKTINEIVEERAEHRLSDEESKRILRELLTVLYQLHRRESPIVHRDIKPSNIIYNEEDGATLIDFDAVYSEHSDGMTMIGTAGYMAPEVFAGEAGPSSDIYALGATLFYCVTGLSPFDIESDNLRLQYERYLPRTLSPVLRTCLRRMLEPSPEDRADIEELLDILNEKKEIAEDADISDFILGGLLAIFYPTLLFVISVVYVSSDKWVFYLFFPFFSLTALRDFILTLRKL